MAPRLASIVRFGDRYGVGFVAYVSVAGLSAATEWATFYVSLQHLGSIAAAFVEFFFGTLANFLLSRGFVFRSRRPARLDFLLVYVVSGLAFIVNLMTYPGLYFGVGLDVIVSKVLGTCCGFLFNFGARQFYVFAREPRFVALSQPMREPSGSSDRDAEV
jgi:putative flippase GtrA